MATVHSTPTTSCHEKFIPRVSPECSIIVDDVDEVPLRNLTTQRLEEERMSPNSEYTSNRIKEFQRVAEWRKLEFERLLEEHAQVIRRLKQMEESDREQPQPQLPATSSA